jgi:L-lysine exporter family protein LysE/ArgO
MTFVFAPAFFAGMVLSLSLIMAIGPQNAHVIRMGLLRQHVGLTLLVCVMTDVALIGLGVAGLAQLGALPDKVLGAISGAGALLLVGYGVGAMKRFLQPATPAEAAGAAPDCQATQVHISRRRAVGMALALSWLNPHAWLDTAVLIGTASLAYSQPDNAVFGLGAAAGSLVWFSALGAAMWWLGRRLNSPLFWRLLDGVVALMMWGTAAWLLAGLFTVA